MASSTNLSLTPAYLTGLLDNDLLDNTDNQSQQLGDVLLNNKSLLSPGTDGAVEMRSVPLLKHSTVMAVILTIAYMLVLLLALVSNSLVVLVIYRNPQMRNVTNYFLANLAVADILVSLVLLPITLLSNLFTEWWFGWFPCKAIPYLQAVAVSASVNTLAAVAAERYFTIFYPHATIIKPRTAVGIICVIWLVPMCIQVPWALYHTQTIFRPRLTKPYTICYPDFKSKEFERGFFLGAMFLTCYLVPLCFLCICYAMIGIRVWRRNVSGIRGSRAERNIQRSKIRIVRMLIAVAVMFALSWLPLYSIRLRILYGDLMRGTEKKAMLHFVIPFAQWMGSANSCVNPFIYCYFSEHFRKSMIAVLKSRSCCEKIKV